MANKRTVAATLAFVEACRKNLIAISAEESSDDDSSEDDLLFLEIVRNEISKNKRKRQRVCVERYFEVVVPTYTDETFRNHFILSRGACEELLRLIEHNIVNAGPGRPSLPAMKQLLMTLWLLGSMDSYRYVADKFEIAQSTLWQTFARVITAISTLSNDIIHWPTFHEYHDIQAAFLELSGFPGIIGCIGALHIPIKAPSHSEDIYVNKRGFPSVVLQAVCDHNLNFTDCFTGCSGSSNDAAVFEKSSLSSKLNVPDFLLPNSYLLGDITYPLSNRLITPYIDNGQLTDRHKKFNTLHSTASYRIHHAFVVLKGRFQRLKHLDMACLDLIPLTIMACCVLHNIRLQHNGTMHEYYELDPDDLTVHADDIHVDINSQNEEREKLLETLVPQ